MRLGRLATVAAPLAALAATLPLWLAAPAAQAAPPTLEGVRVVEAWPTVSFAEPIQVGHGNDGTDDLYVLEQPGVLKRIAKYRGVGPVPQPTVALNLAATGKVHAKAQGGALGLAFHPRFRENGRFFLTYVTKVATDAKTPYRLVVSEFRMTNGASSPASERVVLEVPKTRDSHQAGGLGFGPDGKLYLGVGDNGSENDSEGNSQSPATMLGKILRIDVDVPGKPYGVPADNPWAAAGAGVRPEIWGYGFRNPWRFTWDPQGNMILGEPGSKGPECREWVTSVVRGGNHGWPHMEGTRPNPKRPAPAGSQFVPRLFDYGRTDPEASSCIIGGVFYAGTRIPGLKGRYVFADYSLGEVYALTITGSGAQARGSDWRTIGAATSPVSFDTDAQGEIYICCNEKADSGGTVLTLAPK